MNRFKLTQLIKGKIGAWSQVSLNPQSTLWASALFWFSEFIGEIKSELPRQSRLWYFVTDCYSGGSKNKVEETKFRIIKFCQMHEAVFHPKIRDSWHCVKPTTLYILPQYWSSLITECCHVSQSSILRDARYPKV